MGNISTAISSMAVIVAASVVGPDALGALSTVSWFGRAPAVSDNVPRCGPRKRVYVPLPRYRARKDASAAQAPPGQSSEFDARCRAPLVGKTARTRPRIDKEALRSAA